ncbi:putative HAD superfamily protein [Helianthus anomalus]
MLVFGHQFSDSIQNALLTFLREKINTNCFSVGIFHTVLTLFFFTVENNSQKLLLKEIRKLWEKQDSNLPWEIGEYGESNTLLVDTKSHRALLNPVSAFI